MRERKRKRGEVTSIRVDEVYIELEYNITERSRTDRQKIKEQTDLHSLKKQLEHKNILTIPARNLLG